VIKLSDYIARHLADYGVRHLFMLTGGGAMHLNDSLGHETENQGDLQSPRAGVRDGR